MIQKIISGGNKGVERAALDIAKKLGIESGGWIPAWRAEEEEELIKNYDMEVMPGSNYVNVVENNIADSDGVLIIGQGMPTGNSALNKRLAKQYNRAWLYIDLDIIPEFKAAQEIESWIVDNQISTLKITGFKESKDKDIYKTAKNILETVFQLLLIDPRMYESPLMEKEKKASSDKNLEKFIKLPANIKEAVRLLMSRLTFQEKTRIANLAENRLQELIPSLGVYIKNEFRMWQKNDPLSRECQALSDDIQQDPIIIIIKALWQKLQTADGVLRVVK